VEENRLEFVFRRKYRFLSCMGGSKNDVVGAGQAITRATKGNIRTLRTTVMYGSAQFNFKYL
jgi:hypothetical protein